MSLTAAIRASEWHLPLFLHVLGAMVLVGALAAAAWFLFSARRDDSLRGVVWGARTLLLAALPSYILMRVAAEWIASEENLSDSDAAWISIGFITTDAGALLLLVALIAVGVVVRRARRTEAGTGRSPAASPAVAVAAWATTALVAVFVIAIWAMTTKPI